MTEGNSTPLQIRYDGDPKLRDLIVGQLKETYDPEIPVDIYELGLVYDVTVAENGHATVRMTLTSPACPAAESLPGEIEARIGSIEGIEGVTIDLVWDPPWTQDMMSEVARVSLGFF